MSSLVRFTTLSNSLSSPYHRIISNRLPSATTLSVDLDASRCARKFSFDKVNRPFRTTSLPLPHLLSQSNPLLSINLSRPLCKPFSTKKLSSLLDLRNSLLLLSPSGFQASKEVGGTQFQFDQLLQLRSRDSDEYDKGWEESNYQKQERSSVPRGGGVQPLRATSTRIKLLTRALSRSKTMMQSLQTGSLWKRWEALVLHVQVKVTREECRRRRRKTKVEMLSMNGDGMKLRRISLKLSSHHLY